MLLFVYFLLSSPTFVCLFSFVLTFVLFSRRGLTVEGVGYQSTTSNDLFRWWMTSAAVVCVCEGSSWPGWLIGAMMTRWSIRPGHKMREDPLEFYEWNSLGRRIRSAWVPRSILFLCLRRRRRRSIHLTSMLCSLEQTWRRTATWRRDLLCRAQKRCIKWRVVGRRDRVVMEVVGYERNLAPHQPLLTSFPPSGK